MLKLGKGWRKWLMIGFIVVLVALAVLAFTTGCSSKPATTTTTPLQSLQNDVDAVEASLDTLGDTVWSNTNGLAGLGTRTTNLETWKASVDEKITNLETGGIPEANMSDIEARLTFLELQYEGIINSGTPTPTPTATGTPTPTPTPIVYCGIHRPLAEMPLSGVTNVNISDGQILFQWSEAINAIVYEFWFGTDSSNMQKIVEIDDFSTNYYLHVSNQFTTNTYYFWKIVVRDACGNVQTNTWWFKTLP